MRKFHSAVLAGAAAIAVAGSAIAASRDVHSLNVSMPDGTVAHITYHGDVAPNVRLEPAEALLPPLAVFDGPWISIDRMAAQFDASMREMVNKAGLLGRSQGAADGFSLARLPKHPAGVVEYYSTTISTGSGSCTRTVQVTAASQNQAPKVLSSASGDCASRPGQSMSTSGTQAGAANSGAAQGPGPVHRT